MIGLLFDHRHARIYWTDLTSDLVLHAHLLDNKINTNRATQLFGSFPFIIVVIVLIVQTTPHNNNGDKTTVNIVQHETDIYGIYNYA